MSDHVVICNKLKVLLRYYKELQELVRSLTIGEYLSQLLLRRAVERQLQLIVECGTDINNMILRSLGQGPAKDYFNSFVDLAENNVLDMEFALEIAPSTGLRNILVHEYTKIDDVIVYHSISDVLKYYGQYIQTIAGYLECEM